MDGDKSKQEACKKLDIYMDLPFRLLQEELTPCYTKMSGATVKYIPTTFQSENAAKIISRTDTQQSHHDWHERVARVTEQRIEKWT